MKRKNKLILGASFLLVPTMIYAAVTQADNLDVRDATEDPNTATATSATVGYDNYAGVNSLTVGGRGYAKELSFSVGHSNDVKNLSAAVGYLNNVNYDATSTYPRSSFASGTYNTVLGNHALASGYNNDIDADSATTLGKGLINTTDNSTIVGKYNESKAGVLFVVGKGASGARANALEVHDDGSVIINQAQGDIDMGGFGSP